MSFGIPYFDVSGMGWSMSMHTNSSQVRCFDPEWMDDGKNATQRAIRGCLNLQGAAVCSYPIEEYWGILLVISGRPHTKIRYFKDGRSPYY